MLGDLAKPERGQDPSPLPLLRVSGLGIVFGGVTALDDLSFDLAAGQILSIIGPNGAGKTTLFNCLSRLYAPDHGEILLDGKSILSTPSHRIAHLGVSRTFQNLGLIRSMSVFDNICLGMHAASSGNILSDALNLLSARRRDAHMRALGLRLLEDFGLQDHAETIVTELPFALQKRVELVRALAGQPKLLLLDEPASGLTQTIADNLRIGAMTRCDAAGISADLEQVYMWFPKLRDRRSQRAGTLSGGEQQMLSIGRALMLRPKLLLLDEPSFGLAPKIVEDIFEIMSCLKQKQSLGLLIVEQNAGLCLDLADDAYILKTGSIAMHGRAADLRHSDHIRSLYFGHAVA